MAHAHVPSLSERIAFGATLACLAHCLALPLLAALLPTITQFVPVPEVVHIAALLLAIPASGHALWSGWRGHRDARPLLVGIAGLILLAAGVLIWGHAPTGTGVTVAGSVLLVIAHLANWRLRRGRARA